MTNKWKQLRSICYIFKFPQRLSSSGVAPSKMNVYTKADVWHVATQVLFCFTLLPYWKQKIYAFPLTIDRFISGASRVCNRTDHRTAWNTPFPTCRLNISEHWICSFSPQNAIVVMFGTCLGSRLSVLCKHNPSKNCWYKASGCSYSCLCVHRCLTVALRSRFWCARDSSWSILWRRQHTAEISAQRSCRAESLENQIWAKRVKSLG